MSTGVEWKKYEQNGQNGQKLRKVREGKNEVGGEDEIL